MSQISWQRNSLLLLMRAGRINNITRMEMVQHKTQNKNLPQLWNYQSANMKLELCSYYVLLMRARRINKIVTMTNATWTEKTLSADRERGV